MSKPPERSWMLATLIGSSAQALGPNMPAAAAAVVLCKKLLRLIFIAALLLVAVLLLVVVADAHETRWARRLEKYARCGRRILWSSTGTEHQRERSTPPSP